MNTRAVGNNFLILGVVLLVAAVAWWVSFYGPIVHRLGGSMSRVTSCLYTQGGMCGFARSVAELAGQSNPYHPIVCWAGAACLLVGVALRLSR